MSKPSDKTRPRLTNHFTFAVIGSGPAGQKAAIQAATAGASVVIVESEPTIGGSCVHRGTIPSKTLRENAVQLQRLHKNSKAFSFALKDDVELSTLTRRVGRVVDAHSLYMRRQLERKDITIMHGRAAFTSAYTIQVVAPGGLSQDFSADYFVIATGSRPRDPGDIPVDHEHILDSDSFLSINYLPRSLVVYGGGVIACEYASVFAALDVDVSIIDRSPRPLAFLDQELSRRFITSFEGAGGRYFAERQIENVHWDGLEYVVTELSDGTIIRSDKALVALGRVANVEKLNLAAAGLAANQRGRITVDEHCRTIEEPHIYAIGDIIGPPGLASTAMEQGRRAACHALALPLSAPATTIPVGIFTIPELASVGIDEAAVSERYGEAPIVGRATFDEIARGQISGVTDGMLKIIADPSGHEVLGVQIAGDGATELIHLGQMALVQRASVDSFVDTIFNFPTFAEGYRVAALAIVDKRQVMAKKPECSAAQRSPAAA